MKISILLPYKENFTSKKAGAVSIFVNSILKEENNNKNYFVFGNTDDKKYLDNRYINLKLKNNLFNSKTNSYIKLFLENEKKNPSSLIEIHNRPIYVKKIRNQTNAKIVLYFHNDPLSMHGSKSIDERISLINDVDHFIFNSQWSFSRFKKDIKNFSKYESKFSVIYQCVKPTKVNFKKKKNIISFIGKLNSAKGFDIFVSAVTKILTIKKDWKVLVIGDEPREKIAFDHERIINYGFKDHEFILDKLKEVSISVICSRWDEPLGRASIEAASRGSVPIITNKGGLPETSKYAVILKSLSEKVLKKKILDLINNNNLLKELQKKNYNEFIFTPKNTLDKINKIRNSLLNKFKINFHNKKNNFKIFHITNFNEKHNGRLHYNTGRRINNGFIRNNHIVYTLSDRDFTHYSKNLIDIKGTNNFNIKIIEINKTFKPDIIVLGHADSVNNSTIDEIKNINKNIKIAQWFLDPVSKKGPDYQKNKERVLDKSIFCDTTFITTSPDAIDFNLKNSFFLPNPSDSSFEILNNHNNDLENDLFFAMSHGVHRGVLKKGKIDKREIFLNKLINISDKSIKFDFYGLNNKQPVWGNEFLEAISNCKMGLNLSRGEPLKYYSSDRIAQLIGNGLLTFIDRKTCLDDFFTDKEAVFYNNLSDLSEKILKFKKDVKLRKNYARNGKNKYMKHFNSDIVSQYILDKTFNLKNKYNYIW